MALSRHGAFSQFYYQAAVFGTFGILAMLAGGCTNSQDSDELTGKNLVKAGDSTLNREIGSAQVKYQVLGQKAFQSQIETGQITADSTATPPPLVSPIPEGSLVFGMPTSQLGQPLIFGNVITEVSDSDSVDLGGIKLTDIPPFQVVASVKTIEGKTVLALSDCDEKCTAESPNTGKVLLQIPVVGTDTEKQVVYLNLAELGQKLDLMAVFKDHPVLMRFKAKSSKVIKMDYSFSTLVFDVQAHLVDVNAVDPSTAKETLITNRWYIRNSSSFNPTFVQRKPLDEVGFFLTDRSKDPLVQRWDFDKRSAEEGIKYYIKNVPIEHQAAFKSGFEQWNEKLLPVLGKKVFSYEFIAPEDPRNELLVAGDPRYNILEWDLKNKASYGGLGPSIANQYTGELFQATVLIQGPTIIQLYSKWFKAHTRAESLRERGMDREADRVLAKNNRETRAVLNRVGNQSFEINLGDSIRMNVRSQQPSLEDPLMSRDDFELIPEGYTFDTYMSGYFADMIKHELGHNLGLRHNFKGNLGAKDELVKGGVSRSVMEYLGRGYRHLDEIGDYDIMAVSYGYMGVLPAHRDWFCTDEDAAQLGDSTKSAECTPNDATNDPFSFFIGRMSRGAHLLIGSGYPQAPEWTLEDMKAQMDIALVGLGAYSVSSGKTAESWENFFSKPGRPRQAEEIKKYVAGEIKGVLCNPTLETEANSKTTEEAKAKALDNLNQLRLEAKKVLKDVYSSAELSCS